MTCYVYLREEGKEEISRYLKQNQLINCELIYDLLLTKLHWSERVINDVVKHMRRGDVLVTYEPNHLACSTAQVLEILTIAATRGFDVHFVKYDAVIKGDEASKEILNLISRAEGDFVSKRTTEALARRKAKGLPLGRPKGRQNKELKLDKHREEIKKYLSMGISKASISKLIACHPQTLYDWLDRKEHRKSI